MSPPPSQNRSRAGDARVGRGDRRLRARRAAAGRCRRRGAGVLPAPRRCGQRWRRSCRSPISCSASIRRNLLRPQARPPRRCATPVERASTEPTRRVERSPRGIDCASRNAQPRRIRPSSILIGVFALIAAIGVLWALSLKRPHCDQGRRDQRAPASGRSVPPGRQRQRIYADPDRQRSGGRARHCLLLVSRFAGHHRHLGIARAGPESRLPGLVPAQRQQRLGAGPTFLVNQQGESVQRLAGRDADASPGSRSPRSRRRAARSPAATSCSRARWPVATADNADTLEPIWAPPAYIIWWREAQ